MMTEFIFNRLLSTVSSRIAARERVYDASRCLSQLEFDHFFCDEHRGCVRMRNAAASNAAMLYHCAADQSAAVT
ncbi:MAG: hypothetical protein Q7T86_01330 [Hyphomicrobiaceae bacterium]|nr:hypothetical protein [Hyphomicrobiaceae bacterium]